MSVPWKALVPGAALVGVAVAALEVASAYLLGPSLAHKSQIYGALGVAATALVWLYLLGRTMVASAILNASLREQRSTRGAPPRDQGATRRHDRARR